MGSESEAESVSEEVSDNLQLERESVDLGDTAQESLVNRVCELYAEENGEEATINDVRDVFAQVKRMFAEEAQQEQYDETDEDESDAEELTETESEAISEAESDVDELDEEQFADEFDLALEHVRELATAHRDSFVNALCDSMVAQSGQEPTAAELYGVLGAIKQCFAEEALEESDNDSTQASDSAFEEESEEESYDPEQDSFDYGVDAEDSMAFATSASDSEYESESHAVSDVSSVVDVEDATESELESEQESEVDLSEQDSYEPDEDSFDYAVDAEDDIVSSTESCFAEQESESEYESQEESESEPEELSEQDSYDP